MGGPESKPSEYILLRDTRKSRQAQSSLAGRSPGDTTSPPRFYFQSRISHESNYPVTSCKHDSPWPTESAPHHPPQNRNEIRLPTFQLYRPEIRCITNDTSLLARSVGRSESLERWRQCQTIAPQRGHSKSFRVVKVSGKPLLVHLTTQYLSSASLSS
jgi:hypothetical protein